MQASRMDIEDPESAMEGSDTDAGSRASSDDAPETPRPPAESGESLEQYLREISQWELLSPQAERNLAKKTAKGDPEALEELVLRNLRLVIYWAKRYRSAGLPLQDLIQEGNIGLMRAAEKFDPRKGTRFSTYASWWIRQALARAICDKQDLIRIPVHMHQKLRRVDRLLEGVRNRRNGGETDIEKKIDASGIVPFREWESARRLQQPISLDRRIDPDRDGPIEVEDTDSPSPVMNIFQGEMRDYILRLLDQLPPRHRIVLRLRYGLEDGTEHTLESIGRRLSISRERVRQIQSEAIEKVSKIASEQDPSYLPLATGRKRGGSRRSAAGSLPAHARLRSASRRSTSRPRS
ncbi:MAG TPA: sigma-70 family RNA polymerase sigma factor [Candidatus Saccharimonadales bacterium]|nr:sigma-70 family RNA polymerase sigma factor [Candidatus Saccharimonadales bacterium]